MGFTNQKQKKETVMFKMKSQSSFAPGPGKAMKPSRRRWAVAAFALAALFALCQPGATLAQPFAYVAVNGTGNVSVINTASNTVVVTVAVGFGPSGIAITPDGSRAFVTNVGADNVSVINTASNTVVATVAVGGSPYGIAITPDGSFAYVANAGSDNVSVINTASNTVVTTVAVGAEPGDVAITPDGSLAYVTNSLSDDVSVINTASNTVVATVAVGRNPGNVAITPDGSLAYVTNSLSDNVSVINTASNTVVATVTVGFAPYGVAITSAAVSARPFVFVADGLIKINQNKASDGDIQSNYGEIRFDKGAPGTHTGNLFAGEDIKIDKQNTIAGDATAAGEIHLSSGATITGSKNPHTSIDVEALPNPSFSAGGPNKTVKKSKSLTLPPGSYGIVKVETKATLKLSAGDYYMRILDTDTYAKIVIDVSGGAVNINVVDELCFDQQIKVEISGGGTEQVTFTTLQHNKVQIGQKSIIRGNLIAPEAEVHFDKECKFKGAVYAESITLDAKVQFYHHGSSAFFKESEEEVAVAEAVVTDYVLEQNYPNPFNPTTVISFQLPVDSEVTLSIYNLNGQLVKQVASGKFASGRHNFTWDATDDRGLRVASGVYLYVIKAGEFTAQRKLLLMK
jgi:YVTN family beta-propeller protein